MMKFTELRRVIDYKHNIHSMSVIAHVDEADASLKSLIRARDGNELDKLHSKFKALELKHENELRLRKDIELVLDIEQENIEKLKIRLKTLENEHSDMIKKAEEFESKYMDELILKKALIKENQELVEERDNALKLVEKNSQPPASFICPISLEVMKDPHITADGYTYESESIKEWLNTGHTSPMTNLELSHLEIVPNRALKSVIEELGFN